MRVEGKAKAVNQLSGQIVCGTFVYDFTSPVGITFEIGNESREMHVFKMFSMMNRYAWQKLAGEVLDKWQDVTQ